MKQQSISLSILCLIICVFLCACAARQPGMVRDLEILPQDALHYVQASEELLICTERQNELYQDFLNRFYAPWTLDEPKFSAQEVFRGLDRYRSRDIYSENNLPLPPGWIDEMEKKSNADDYPSIHLPGITVVHTSMRVLPTSRPVFLTPTRPGEGFPFDYMQNSLLPAGTPLLITHVSRDKKWILAETDYVAGWIRRNDVAIADEDFVSSYQTESMAGFMSDDVAVVTIDGRFVFSGRVGMILPLDKEQDSDEFLQVLIPVKDHQGYAGTVQAEVSNIDFQELPFLPSQKNFARVLNALMGQKYGWGGLYENRDCSALLQDVFAGFGISIPRNSSGQAEAGMIISLEGLTANEKHDLIVEKGRPWLTILYMPGHVMLYIGKDSGSGKIAVYHSMWGLRTWRPFREGQGRWVIGRTVITSLEPGREMLTVRPRTLLAERITRMVLPVESSLSVAAQ